MSKMSTACDLCGQKKIGGAKGGAAARSANACIRHWLESWKHQQSA